jgi:hypothetical protein
VREIRESFGKALDCLSTRSVHYIVTRYLAIATPLKTVGRKERVVREELWWIARRIVWIKF